MATTTDVDNLTALRDRLTAEYSEAWNAQEWDKARSLKDRIHAANRDLLRLHELANQDRYIRLVAALRSRLVGERIRAAQAREWDKARALLRRIRSANRTLDRLYQRANYWRARETTAGHVSLSRWCDFYSGRSGTTVVHGGVCCLVLYPTHPQGRMRGAQYRGRMPVVHLVFPAQGKTLDGVGI